MLDCITGRVQVEDIDGLTYNELRKLAKSFNLKTNKKAVKLRADLKKILHTSMLIKEQNSISVQHDDRNVASSKTIQQRSGSSPCSINEQVNESSFQKTALDAHTTSSPAGSSKSHHRSSDNHELNITYELETPALVTDTLRGNSPDSSQTEHPLFHEALPVIPNTLVTTRSKESQIVRRAGNITKSYVRPVPDFHRIHAKAASKLESISQYARRRQIGRTERRPPFASPQYRSSMHEKVGCAQQSSAVPLSDLSNRPAQVQSHSTCTHDTLVQDSVMNTSNSGTTHAPIKHSNSFKKFVPQIPLDSAFARRKAYDMQRANQRRTGTPKRASSSFGQASHSSMTTQSPWDSKITIRRRDPLVRSLSLHANAQRQRAADMHERFRKDAKSVVADMRRGLC